LKGIFADVMATAGRTQLRIAETEKYPHVTFFFNGGFDTPWPGEDRILVPSPRDVPTYDLKPEMSAFGITEKILPLLENQSHDAIVLNFANGDMVGHTGVFAATRKAVEVVDTCLGRILKTLEQVGGAALVTADHGNCEQMWDPVNDCPHTAHTTNNVPCWFVGNAFQGIRLRDGCRLADVAPTMLTMMGLDPSSDMGGKSIIG